MPSALAEDAPQVKPPKRFSWDIRPGKCFARDVPQGIPMCAEPANWPDWTDTVSRVQLLFAELDFELIARAERELGFSDQRFSTKNPTHTTGEYYFDAWYWALYVLFRRETTSYADTRKMKGGHGRRRLRGLGGSVDARR
jgi:hypothetical protein